MLKLLLLLPLLVSLLTAWATTSAGAARLLPEYGPRQSAPPQASAACIRSVLAFGDSTTDTGNAVLTSNPAFQIANSPPYGMTYFGHPTGRFCDGRLMLDFLTHALGLPDFLPPHLSLNTPGAAIRSENFAVAGASALNPDVLKQVANTSSLTPYSLGSELNWFHADVPSPPSLDQALVYFGEIGGNDYNYAFAAMQQQAAAASLAPTSTTSSNDPQAVIANLVAAVLAKVELSLHSILKAGVKNIVVQGEFPMGCMPVYLKQAAAGGTASMGAGVFDEHGCVAAVSAVSDAHNQGLGAILAKMQALFPAANIVFFNTAAAYLHILDHAAAFGFTNVSAPCLDLGTLLTDPNAHIPPPTAAAGGAPPVAPPPLPACADPSSYISWDGIHMTDAMYNAMVNLFLGDGSGTFSSPTLHAIYPPKCS